MLENRVRRFGCFCIQVSEKLINRNTKAGALDLTLNKVSELLHLLPGCVSESNIANINITNDSSSAIAIDVNFCLNPNRTKHRNVFGRF